VQWVILSATGRLAQVELPADPWRVRAAQGFTRVDHDVLASAAPAQSGGVGAVTDRGNAHRLSPDALPALVPGGPWSLWDGPTPAAVLPLAPGERLVGLYSLDPEAAPLALGTRAGVVKRVVPEYKGWDTWQVMAVRDDDAIVGVAQAGHADELVFATRDAQLLRLSAGEVRAQGRPAGGMTGIKLDEESVVIYFGAVARPERDEVVVASLASGPSGPATAKITPFAQYPAKGRATTGVRTHRFLKGQDHLGLAWVGLPPVRACDSTGSARNLPSAEDRRDGTGAKVYGPYFAFG
jgi:DNA gyrase subunit A